MKDLFRQELSNKSKKTFFYEVMPSTSQIQNVINIINKGLLSVYIYIIHSIETYTKVKVAVN